MSFSGIDKGDITAQSSSATVDERGDVHLVECGYHSAIYQLNSGGLVFRRGTELIVRTDRGLELATVLSSACVPEHVDLFQAKYIRRCHPEDRFLWDQIKQLSQKSGQACQDFLVASGADDVLIEVEPLLDGKTIYFHFLGQISAETESHVEQLAEVYRKEIANSHFAHKLEAGCGPGCGTAAKSACGTSSGCSTCSLSGGCSVRKTSKSKD